MYDFDSEFGSELWTRIQSWFSLRVQRSRSWSFVDSGSRRFHGGSLDPASSPLIFGKTCLSWAPRLVCHKRKARVCSRGTGMLRSRSWLGNLHLRDLYTGRRRFAWKSWTRSFLEMIECKLCRFAQRLGPGAHASKYSNTCLLSAPPAVTGGCLGFGSTMAHAFSYCTPLLGFAPP